MDILMWIAFWAAAGVLAGMALGLVGERNGSHED